MAPWYFSEWTDGRFRLNISILSIKVSYKKIKDVNRSSVLYADANTFQRFFLILDKSMVVTASVTQGIAKFIALTICFSPFYITLSYAYAASQTTQLAFYINL